MSIALLEFVVNTCIVTLGEFYVVGIAVDCKTHDLPCIRKVWERLMLRLGEITGSPGVCGICSYQDVEGNFNYLVGYQVDRRAEVPEGMEMWKVGAQRYIANGNRNLPKEISQYWQEIVEGKNHESGVETGSDGPWLELYAENCHDSEVGSITCDLYTPIIG